MSIRRLALVPVMVAGVLFLAVALQARFPKIQISKPPSVPGVTQPAPTPAPEPFCGGITDADIDKFLKAKGAEKKVLQDGMAAARANQAKADALAKTRGERMMAEMMKASECKDAFKEKDPRSKEIARLEGQVEAAGNAGDEAKAEALRKRLDPLNEALELDADRACGGKGTAALLDCIEKKKVELAKKEGLTEPMLSIQAQAACMQDPTTSGFAGATAASAEEEAANAAAQNSLSGAKANAEATGQKEAKLTKVEYAKLDHCIRRVLANDPTTDATLESKGAIRKRADELEAALR